MKILCVDDDTTSLMLLKRLLSNAGHDTREASDGRAALTILDEEKVDLVIADMHMPALSGLELVNAIRANPLSSRTPIIFCTADATRRTVTEAISKGIAGYIVKPISQKGILTAIEKVKQSQPNPLENLSQVLGRLGLSKDQYLEMLQVLTESSRKHVDDLWNNLEHQQAEQFIRIVRMLASAADNLGAIGLREAALNAANGAENSSRQTRESHIKQIKVEVDQLEKTTIELSANADGTALKPVV